MSDQTVVSGPIFNKKERHRLDRMQRMIDRLEHRLADPQFQKGTYWMTAEVTALRWAMRVLQANPDLSLGEAIRADRPREGHQREFDGL